MEEQYFIYAIFISKSNPSFSLTDVGTSEPVLAPVWSAAARHRPAAAHPVAAPSSRLSYPPTSREHASPCPQ